LNSGFEGRGVFLGGKTERSWRIGKRKKKTEDGFDDGEWHRNR
jgi:hypothetical protein